MPRPRLPRICSNIRCKTVDTPLWRKGWNRDDGTNARLCNACGLHWRKGHFCPYSWCFAVYKEHETDGFVGTWLKCKRCSRWSHIACILMAKELKRRTCDKEHPNYQSVLADVRNTVEAALQSNPKLGESLPLPHYCPDCEVVQQPPRQSRQATTTKRVNNKITQSPALSSSPSKRKSQNVLLEDDDDDVDDEDEHEEEEAMETDSDPEPIVQSKKKKQSTTINKLSSSPSKHKQSSTQSPSTSSTKFSSVRMRSTRLQKKRKVIYDDNDYDYEHDDDDFIEEASEEKYEYHLRSVTNGKRALGSATPSPSTSPKAHRGSPHSHSSHTSQHTDLSDQPTSDMDESSCISLHGFPASPESKIISNSPHSWTIPIRRQSSRQTQKEVPISSPSKKASSASASFTKQQSSMRFMGSSQAASEPSESVTRVSMTMAFDMQRALDLINQEIIKESSCDVQKRSNTTGSPRTSNNNNSNTCNNNNNSVSISNNNNNNNNSNNNNNNSIPIPDNMRCLWAVCEIELQNLAAL